MPTTGIDVQHNSPPHQGRYTMADEWHYSAGGTPPIGPVSAGELRELAAAGKLAPTDLVWKEGLAEWVPASKLKGLFRGVDKEREPTSSSKVFTDSTDGPTATIASPLPIERLIPASVHVSTAVPWNPIALVVLGLACSPLWAAVMLALNGRRLGSNRSTWIPVSGEVPGSDARLRRLDDRRRFLPPRLASWSLEDRRPVLHCRERNAATTVDLACGKLPQSARRSESSEVDETGHQGGPEEGRHLGELAELPPRTRHDRRVLARRSGGGSEGCGPAVRLAKMTRDSATVTRRTSAGTSG